MLFNPKSNSLNTTLGSSPVEAKRYPGWLYLEKPLNIPPSLKQIIRFGSVGVLNTLLDAALYFLLSRSGLISNLVLAKGISYGVGMLNSFYWNKSWTFQSRVESRQVFLPFIAANLLAVGLNTGVMHLALDTFGLPESGALILATVAVFVWNFVTNKFFIFK